MLTKANTRDKLGDCYKTTCVTEWCSLYNYQRVIEFSYTIRISKGKHFIAVHN